MGERPITLSSSDFQLFGLEQRFAQDDTAIDARWKELQREAHPDRFAVQASSAQRLAMQWSVRINEAYQRLKNPLQRAAYLCELHGASVNAESNTAMPAAFLMQQMAWRESLEDIQALTAAPDKAKALEALLEEVHALQAQVLAQAASLIDEAQDFQSAVGQVRSLMFIDKFAQEVQQHLDR